MPEEGFSYAIGIEDALSGPARNEREALKALEGQVEKTEKALRALRREQLAAREAGDKPRTKQLGFQSSRMGLDIGAAKAEIEKLKKSESESLLGNIGEHLVKGAGGSALLAGGLAAVGFAAATAVEKLGELGVESVKFAIEASEFKHNTEIAYAAVKGTAAEGEETFKQIDAMAREVHLPAEQAHKLASELMLQGLEDTKAIGGVIAANAALIRTGQVEGAEKLRSVIERSLASGHFDIGRGMGGAKGGAMSGRALAGLGVHMPELIDDIAKRTGQSIEQVKGALAKGTIDTKVGIAALTDAIDKSPIGTAAKSKFDFGDFFTDLGNKWRGIVQDVDLAPIEQGLLDLQTALGSVDGSGIKSVFQTVVDGIGEAIEQVTIFGQDVEIASLEAQIALQPLTAIFEEIGKGIDKLGSIGAIGSGAEGSGPGVEGLDLSYQPANAAGGEIMAPAPGEVFASVAPGEFIVPAGATPGNDNGGGGQVIHVDVGGLHFHGAVDQHNVIPLLESQLADVFERVALEVGR